jgi:hypothetical protein
MALRAFVIVHIILDIKYSCVKKTGLACTTTDHFASKKVLDAKPQDRVVDI